MDRPKQKWWDVNKFDIGRTLGNPDYIEWADKRIDELEAEIEMLKASQQSVKGGKCPYLICQFATKCEGLCDWVKENHTA